jgi:hypothetical protein
MSLGYYEDIRKFAEKSTSEGRKWAPDAYMQEIMGTSLVSRIKGKKSKIRLLIRLIFVFSCGGYI